MILKEVGEGKVVEVEVDGSAEEGILLNRARSLLRFPRPAPKPRDHTCRCHRDPLLSATHYMWLGVFPSRDATTALVDFRPRVQTSTGKQHQWRSSKRGAFQIEFCTDLSFGCHRSGQLDGWMAPVPLNLNLVHPHAALSAAQHPPRASPYRESHHDYSGSLNALLAWHVLGYLLPAQHAPHSLSLAPKFLSRNTFL